MELKYEFNGRTCITNGRNYKCMYNFTQENLKEGEGSIKRRISQDFC
jgi:hypothetical protein